jgi:hypothetical protein
MTKRREGSFAHKLLERALLKAGLREHATVTNAKAEESFSRSANKS